jgi:hypothetical protein
MTTKVYCVSFGSDDGSYEIAPVVFTTGAKADAYVAQQKASPDFDADGDWFEVSEHDVQ